MGDFMDSIDIQEEFRQCPQMLVACALVGYQLYQDYKRSRAEGDRHKESMPFYVAGSLLPYLGYILLAYYACKANSPRVAWVAALSPLIVHFAILGLMVESGGM
jgi:hypothetical protein